MPLSEQREQPGTATYLALLRGINVGGNNKLAMKDLAALFAELGCEGVQTYIQSGNVVFRAPEALARQVPERVSGAIAERFGLSVPIVLRSSAELAEVAAHNPYAGVDCDPKLLMVMFLADCPRPEQVAGLDPDRSPPDTFVVRGREVYLHYPGGGARSKLTNAYFDSRLKTVGTMRNWRTVLTLLKMVQG